jgi:hypothetical protein
MQRLQNEVRNRRLRGMWQLSLSGFEIDSAFTRGNLREANKEDISA